MVNTAKNQGQGKLQDENIKKMQGLLQTNALVSLNANFKKAKAKLDQISSRLQQKIKQSEEKKAAAKVEKVEPVKKPEPIKKPEPKPEVQQVKPVEQKRVAQSSQPQNQTRTFADRRPNGQQSYQGQQKHRHR